MDKKDSSDLEVKLELLPRDMLRVMEGVSGSELAYVLSQYENDGCGLGIFQYKSVIAIHRYSPGDKRNKAPC